MSWKNFQIFICLNKNFINWKKKCMKQSNYSNIYFISPLFLTWNFYFPVNFIKKVSHPYPYSRPYFYYSGQICPPVLLFQIVRLFQTLEYIRWVTQILKVFTRAMLVDSRLLAVSAASKRKLRFFVFDKVVPKVD